MDYISLMKELKNKVKSEGLLDKTPKRGAIEIAIVFSAFVITLFLSGKIPTVLNALMMVVVMLRATYVAHDLIHNQYFSKKTDLRISYFFGNVVLGLSANWWKYVHNVLHHTHSNIASKDEDVQAIGGAFAGRRNWGEFFHTYQHIFYWFLLPFITVSFLHQTVKFGLENKKYQDLFFVALHFTIPYYIYTTSTEPLLFLLTMYGIYGFMFGLVIMTNHYGCEIIEDDEADKGIAWLDLQTRTSRNVIGGFIIHFIYGGLNTQIEHHLFPKAPRFYLLEVAKITKEFCNKNHITYYETSPLQAYKEIYLNLAGKGQATLDRMFASRGLLT